MTRFLSFLSFLIIVCCCSSSTASLNYANNKENCKVCDEYIYSTLKPQMELCGAFQNPADGFKLKRHEECKFDADLLREFSSCLFGIKRNELESIIGIGPTYWYACECQENSMRFVLNLKYNASNNRLIEIDHVVDSVSIHKTISCLACEGLYERIKNDKPIKKKNFEEFHEGCLYGKQPDYLANKLGLRGRIEEDNYHFSYNKEVQLGRDTHELNFLFYPGQRMVDISPADSVLNRKNYWAY